jgi:uncharacterized ion transporter superfamily protein YfcC
VDKFGWDCLAGTLCDKFSTNFGQCEMHEDLRDAGRLYTFSQVVVLFYLVFWLQSVIYGIFNIEYGIPLLNYVYIAMAGVAHLSGILGWFDRSEARFDG